jgi:hypothetical protein
VTDHTGNFAGAGGENEPSASEGRKLYCKPSFRFEQVFETMALQCGKTDPTSGNCKFSRQAS